MVLSAATVLLAAQLGPVNKAVYIDDFTEGPYSVTLTNGSQSKNWHNLDRRHCIFGDRATNLQVTSNNTNTWLNLTIGNGTQTFTAGDQLTWRYDIQWGNDGLYTLDLSNVDRFVADFDTDPSGGGPDIVRIWVIDKNGVFSLNGNWHGRPGGVYFRKSEFPQTVDWKHVQYLKFQQDFDQWPNPTYYNLTKFYMTLKPAVIGPGL